MCIPKNFYSRDFGVSALSDWTALVHILHTKYAYGMHFPRKDNKLAGGTFIIVRPFVTRGNSVQKPCIYFGRNHYIA